MNPTPTPPRSLTFRRRALALAAVVMGAVAAPAGAEAAVVTVSPEFPQFAATAIGVTDFDNVDNDITVTFDDDGTSNPGDDRLIIRDEKAPLIYDSQAGLPMQDKQCVEVDPFEVRCRIVAVEDASLFLAGGDDEVRFVGNSPLGNNVFAGAGEDKLIGGPSGDEENLYGEAGDDDIYGGDAESTVNGGPDDDYIEGGAGSDYLTGGLHDDRIRGEAGPDRIIGEGGFDSAIYTERLDPVTADLEGDDDDGTAGEGDEIADDVERLEGGFGADKLTGNSSANELYGGASDDLLRGAGGPDVIDGGSQRDAVSYAGMQLPVTVDMDLQADDGMAGEGDLVKTNVEDVYGGFKGDTLRGSAADNELVGGLGDDTIDGRGGKDTLRAGAGADTLFAQDGLADKLSCGTEDDTFTADAAGDTIDADCQDDPVVPLPPEKPADPQPGTDGTTNNPTKDPTPHVGPKLRIHTKRTRMTAGGVVRLKVSCPATAAGSCDGTLRITGTKRGRKITLAKRRVQVKASGKATVRLRIARRHRGFVALKPRRLLITASVHDALSSSSKSTRRVRVASARRGR